MTHALDLGVSDVHVPGAGGKPAKRSKKRRTALPAEAPKLPRKGRFRMSFDHPDHGRVDVHMKGTDAVTVCRVALLLDAKSAGADGKPVWVQIAKAGEFRGHSAGNFSLNAKVFEDICRNFHEVDHGEVAFDFEHASEVPASEGTVPTEGAPAQAWIRKLDNRGDSLWALVEWLEPARSYVQEGKYRHVSPAIRFGAKHPVSGAVIGARLTSVALTNRPFLRGMEPVRARDDGPSVTMSLGGTCYSSNEYMPRVRAALRVHDLTSAAECEAKLDALEDLLEAAGGDHTKIVQGCCIADYLCPLRELVRAAPNHTWDEVFDAVRALVAAAVAEQTQAVEETDDDEEEDDDEIEPTPMRQPAESTTMSDQNAETTLKLRDLETKNTETNALLTDARAKLNESGLLLKEKDATIATLETDLKALKDAESKRADAERVRLVDEAIATHGAKKGITATDKDDLLAMCRDMPERFARMYPPVAPDKRHLLGDLTGGGTDKKGATAAAAAGEVSVISLRDAAHRIARERGISLGQAQLIAEAAAKRAV